MTRKPREGDFQELKSKKLLVFSVTTFKIDQNKVQNLGNERRYIYKDPGQDSGQRNISYTRYPKNVLVKFTDICMETPCWCPLDGHQHGGRKPTETFVTEFCYKSVNLLLEELINIKVIVFLIHELSG